MGPAPPAALKAVAADRVALTRDLVAGVTVAFVAIPQALAYASVAGMPPVAGLYAAALPLVVASFVASSPYLQTGPVALTSLLTFGALAGHAPVGSPEYLQLGILLALVVGVFRLLVGLARAGLIAHLLSEPMLMGFVPAGAVTIIASQVPALLGESRDGGVLPAAAGAATSPAAWDGVTIAVAATTLAVVIGGRRLHRLFPGVLLTMLAGLVAAPALALPGVGSLPSGLPSLHLDLPYGALPSLLVPGAVIAIVGFAEPAAIARTFAIRERQVWSADRELISQGLANVVAGLSGGYPVGGSMSRTSLNHMAGAVTRRSGAVTGLAVLAALPFASLLSPLPRPVLAAIVVTTVLGLIRPRQLAALWRVSRPQFAVAAITFILTLVLAPHIERAVLAGVALSVLVHLARELSLRIDVTVDGAVLEARPAGVLWFATAHDLQEQLTELLGDHPGAHCLRLSLDGLGRIDLTGAMSLARMLDDLRASGVRVELTGIPPQARDLLKRFGTTGAALA